MLRKNVKHEPIREWAISILADPDSIQDTVSTQSGSKRSIKLSLLSIALKILEINFEEEEEEVHDRFLDLYLIDSFQGFCFILSFLSVLTCVYVSLSLHFCLF